MRIYDRLLETADPAYAAFQAKLTPGIDPGSVLGVRVPELRAFARQLRNDPEKDTFLAALPHGTFDENMLHAILIGMITDFDASVSAVGRFLPFVNNWAVCDAIRPQAFKKNTGRALGSVLGWAASREPYTCRFGVEMLMCFYLDDAFEPALAEIPAGIVSGEYYVNMMLAWYFATALAKQWDAVIPYLEKNRLGRWVHNRTIRKALESFRIPDERKEYLRSLRRGKE